MASSDTLRVEETAPEPFSAKLTRGSIPGHLVGQTLPAIIGVAAVMSIGLVDAYFIGQLGSAELAAIAFIFPISVALTSLGVGVMVGINSVVARALGEEDMDKAARRANFGIAFALFAGLVLGAALYLLIDPLFILMNAESQLRPLIRLYMEPFALGFPLILMIMGFNGVLRGQGEARKTSYVSITYAAANWVLDPILITGTPDFLGGIEGFGITGAAYATIIGWAMGAGMALALTRSAAIPLDPALVVAGRVLDPAKAILKVGLPAAFSNAINPIGLAILTALIALDGGAAVAGFGAAGRLQSFVNVPLLALSGSIGAIVGQNWGARQYDRARDAALYAAGFCCAWGLGVAVLLFATGGWFAQIFTEDPAVVREFDLYLNIAAWGYAGFGLLIVGNGILNAVDKAALALVQSIARVFLVMLPFAWVFLQDWGSGAVYGAELAANVFGGLTALALVRYVLWRVPGR
ncbi:MAG: MATE family efflux transporter [Erythrobacter sp.]|jgi:putative MATE family efflux protein|nr:MATE family efflux transporter [Erythrobacter sp.]